MRNEGFRSHRVIFQFFIPHSFFPIKRSAMHYKYFS